MKVALFGLAAFAFAQTLPSQTLPEGAGKAAVEKMCKGCHGLENIVRSRRTRDKWSEIVDDMVARGAKGTDSEADEVVEYLSTHFGADAVQKVNVNKAGAPDLISALGISTADADTIVRHRAGHGSFKSIQDLMKVPGVDAKKIESNRDRVEF
jgi:competence ComEA-like helix-hairpin-helix protein